jgi:VanZ family protein
MLATAIFIASSRSRVAGPDVTHADKVAHALVFGLLGTLVARTQSRRRWWIGIVVASGYGLFDEWWQSMTPGRSVEVADWVADTAGAALAVTLYMRWKWYRELLEMPLHRRRKRQVAFSPEAAADNRS